ncbi:glycosyltransferase family 4 protein [Aliiroseovarius sp. YM-037]|uniref:glycosyltransferase family 4 protein n=1 Tax=Aliiroseovarius sp. YM-037 TaxID=3341728 RepID=UPI003A7FE83A
MKIAFYSPLKPPDHAIPSGDRLMARLLMQSLAGAGHVVDVASRLRSFLRDPTDATAHAKIIAEAEQERARLTRKWETDGPPDLWFCYHPYYKAPDLIGPALCTAFGVPYVTAETSYSRRRNRGLWASFQAEVLAGTELAAVNICLTERDRDGLYQAATNARFARLRPFIGIKIFTASLSDQQPPRLVTVAMMRAGDKMDSYTRLVAALDLIRDQPWHLSIVGDGALQAEVRELFSGFADDRIIWHGQLDRGEIADLFAQSTLYTWPGCGEAYGLAYLEAQAAGLPVVAYNTAGVPEVVSDGQTGILTPVGDDMAYANAISRLLNDEVERRKMADAARNRVIEAHSIEAATASLSAILEQAVKTS